MRLEAVARCLGEEVEIVGGHSAVVGADVDYDRGLPDDIELICQDVLAGEAALFGTAGRENHRARGRPQCRANSRAPALQGG
jgi:hypothetical protein